MDTRIPERPSPADRLDDLHQKLIAAVEALTESDAWVRMLTVAARFPTYSPSNVLLIALQRPNSTRVAGIRTWNAVGRHVVKGEHGIAILAPCLYTRADEPPSPEGAGDARGAPAHPSADTEPVSRRELRGFKVVHVFDIAQTDGAPLPDVGPALLTGAAPDDLWLHLTRVLAAAEYTLERGDCGAANGYTDPARRIVRIRDDVDSLQAVKTLAHELGHIRADHARRFPEYAMDPVCRGQAEIEAESIAHLVLAQTGLDSTAYSVPYVAHWARGDASCLREAAAAVLTTARGLAPPVPDDHAATSTRRPPSTPRRVPDAALTGPQMPGC